MKKRTAFRVIAAVISLMLVTGMTVLATQSLETINVLYDNIKILIDGKEYIPTDALGNVVEPFIYKGTTYLPVRGIANAFDVEVDWEPQTGTVVLGTKNYDWLDQMGYANYETTGNENKLLSWESDWKGCDGIRYDRGLLLFLGYNDRHGAKRNNDESLSSYQNIEYLLNGSYNRFVGKLVCETGGNNNQNIIVKIYGDGNLLFTSPPMTAGTKSVDFDLDVSKYKVLKINANIPNLNDKNGDSRLGIVDARLAKS